MKLYTFTSEIKINDGKVPTIEYVKTILNGLIELHPDKTRTLLQPICIIRYYRIQIQLLYLRALEIVNMQSRLKILKVLHVFLKQK